MDRTLSSGLRGLELQHEIKQPTTLLTLIQQAGERLSEYDLSPTPLALSKLSLPLLGTMGNVNKKENNYLIHLFCTSRGFSEEGKQ